jgi:hypothetical protein
MSVEMVPDILDVLPDTNFNNHICFEKSPFRLTLITKILLFLIYGNYMFLKWVCYQLMSLELRNFQFGHQINILISYVTLGNVSLV